MMRFLEPDLNPPRYKVALVSSVALILAALASSLVIWGFGVNPLEAVKAILKGTFGDWAGFAEIIRRAIPLLLIGAGLSLAFRAKFFNIGAEGQLLMGAACAGGVALFSPLSGAVGIIAMFAAGFVGGALWCWIPAFLRQRLNVSEILSTLMLNYVATFLLLWLIGGPWKGKTVFGYNRSDPFPDWAILPLIPRTYIHWITLVLGLILSVILQIVLLRSRFGYELQVVGGNPRAAQYAGISSSKVIFGVALISGGLAGLAGVGEVAGIHNRLLDPSQISLGYGFTAIIVAWLARGNPLTVILSSLLMGFVFASGDVLKLNLGMPTKVVDVISGLTLFFLIGSEPFMLLKRRKKV